MTSATTSQRIKKVLTGSNFERGNRESFAFGAAALILGNKELAKEIIGKTFEAKKIQKAYAEDGCFTADQLNYIFRNCLQDTFRYGAHKVYELLLEFENDLDSLKEVVILFRPNADRAAAFSTNINKLALNILKTAKDQSPSLVDYCSGDGVMLCQAFINGAANELYGEEINQASEVVITIKLKVLGCKNVQIVNDDVLKHPAFLGKHARVFANYPLLPMTREESGFVSEHYAGLAKLADNNKLGHIAGDWQFVNILLNSISADGKAVTIMSTSRLGAPKDAAIREQLIKDGKIETVILFGNGAFSNTNLAASMVVLSNNNKAPRLIDARDIMTKKSRSQELSAQDVSDIEKIYLNNNEPNKFVLIPTLSQMAKAAYSLKFSDYVDPLKGMDFANTAALKELVTLQRGIPFVIKEGSDSETGNCYLAKIVNIVDGKLQDLPRIHIEDMKIYAKNTVKKGDILLASRGTQNKAAVVTENYALPLLADQNIYVLRPIDGAVNSYYLNALLNSELGEKILSAIQTGDKIVSLSPNKVREAKIPVISREKQEQLGKKYAAAETEIAELREKIRIKQEERDGLIGKLLEEE